MFGAQVRAHRQRLGMSQEDLANRTGVSVRSIGNLEAERTGRPRPGTVRLLADAFELAGADRERFCRSALEDDDAEAGAGPGRPVPGQLPADVASFVGRTDQLGRLTTLLDGGDRPAAVVISAIAGTAGVGKPKSVFGHTFLMTAPGATPGAWFPARVPSTHPPGSGPTPGPPRLTLLAP